MYIYYYEAKDGKINISYAKVINKKEITRRNKNYYCVELDREICKSKSNTTPWCVVSVEDGHIYQDKFWLSDCDEEKALEIVKNRFRERINEAKEQIKELERYL